jgi:UDP-glucose 4-epimerase
MKILLTGGAGFIGSHIADSLIKKDFEVVIVDNLSTGYKENLNPKAKFFNIDITGISSLKSVFEKEKPDFVIHAAANIKVRYSLENPVFDAEVNVFGSLNVLECCKEFKVKKVIYLCTGGALYGDPVYVPVDEDHPINPLSPYGISKRTVELYLNHYNKSYGLDFLSLRFSNVYGPRDRVSSDHVIPVLIDKMLTKKIPTITGDGKQGRDFIYVADVVEAVMLSLDKTPKERFLNVGTEKVISINDLFNEIKNLLKVQAKPDYVEERKGEVKQIYLSAKKAKKYLDWKAKTGLKEGLMETIRWFKEK